MAGLVKISVEKRFHTAFSVRIRINDTNKLLCNTYEKIDHSAC